LHTTDSIQFKDMNRAERIYRLHALFKDKPPAQLLEELEISRPTFKRDIEYIRDFMGAPIECDRAANGYRYSPSSRFELPGLWRNESELLSLLATENLPEQMQPGLLRPYIGPLRARIRSLLAQSGHKGARVSERILLQPVADRPTHPERFGTIAGTVPEGSKLVIHRTLRPSPTQTDRHRGTGELPAPAAAARAGGGMPAGRRPGPAHRHHPLTLYPKIDAARRTARHMEPARNRSRSFHKLVSGIEAMLA
jgi:hypothetical protein